MTADFTQTTSDFSGLYKDPSAPTDPNPADELYKQLAAQNQAAMQATTQASQPAASATPAATQQAAAVASGSSPAPAPAANPNSTLNPSAETAGLLARLAPLGVKSISELKSKNDVELRRLSTDAVQYEQRQRDLQKHFFRNPDGSWDFTKGPDGRPTGLGPDGKVLPLPGTTPATPTTPAAPGTTPGTTPGSHKGTAVKGETAPKKGTTRKATTTPTRKSSTKVVKKPSSTTTTKPKTKPKAKHASKVTVKPATTLYRSAQ